MKFVTGIIAKTRREGCRAPALIATREMSRGMNARSTQDDFRFLVFLLRLPELQPFNSSRPELPRRACLHPCTRECTRSRSKSLSRGPGPSVADKSVSVSALQPFAFADPRKRIFQPRRLRNNPERTPPSSPLAIREI